MSGCFCGPNRYEKDATALIEEFGRGVDRDAAEVWQGEAPGDRPGKNVRTKCFVI
jgi:hypothetical protein